VPFCIACLLSPYVTKDTKEQPLHAACSGCDLRHKPDLGKSEMIVAHDATGQHPKSDCKQKRPDKYGASMAANTALLLEQRHKRERIDDLFFVRSNQISTMRQLLKIFGEN